MPKKRKKEKMEPMPQRHSWKAVKTYAEYEEADRHREDLKNQGEVLVKVHKQQDLFVVKVGAPIKAAKAEK